MEWTARCKISPVGLVLGLALRGPVRPGEAVSLAKRFWPGGIDGAGCYYYGQVNHVIEYLKTVGVLEERGDGLLVLRRDRLHPYTLLIAERAASFLDSSILL